MASTELLICEKGYEFLTRVAAGIAAVFGEDCETVFQEIHGEDVVTREINNGHVTGRQKGSAIGVFGVPMDVTEEKHINADNINQLVILLNGKQIKCASFIWRGEDYNFTLGINYDMTFERAVSKRLESFLSCEGILYDALGVNDGENAFESTYNNCVEMLHLENPDIKKEQRQALIRLLNERDYFRFRKSVPYLAEKLGVSKYTIYKDLKELCHEI